MALASILLPMGVLEFFGAVWVSYTTDLSLFEQVQAAIPVAAFVYGSFAAARRIYGSRNKHLSLELEEEKETSRRWISKYNEINERFEQCKTEIPEYWLLNFNRERDQGNETVAFGRLRDAFREASPHIAQSADELTTYHLSVALDLGEEEHFAEAKRLCRLAILLGGPTLGRNQVLDEIEALFPNAGAPSQDRFQAWDDIREAFPDQVVSHRVV